MSHIDIDIEKKSYVIRDSKYGVAYYTIPNTYLELDIQNIDDIMV